MEHKWNFSALRLSAKSRMTIKFCPTIVWVHDDNKLQARWLLESVTTVNCANDAWLSLQWL